VKPGSVGWLLAHELRLALRGGKGNRKVVIGLTVLAFVTIAGFAGVPLGLLLGQWTPRLTPELALGLDAALLLILSLMLSQTISQAVEVFYARRDLDLLLSSPLPASRVLAARCLTLAATTTGMYLALITPVLVTVAVFGHLRWLTAYPVLMALGLLATTLGLVLAMVLFALIGPQRTRTTAQLLAAFVGAAFFLGAQAFNFAQDEIGDDFARLVGGWVGSGAFDAGSPLSWPARAVLGEPLPALGMLAAAAALFAITIRALGQRFAENASAAAGRERSAKPRDDRPVRGGFGGGATAAMIRKELKLLARDPALISQVFLRLLYLVPLLFVLWRSADERGGGMAVPSLAAAIVFLTGQLAGSLAWVTVSSEDAPDLLAVSPSPASVLRRAKAAAALIPVAAIMALPLGGFALVSPWAGIVALAGCAVAAVSSVLITLWLGKPGNRRDFNKRQNGSVLANIAEFLVGGAWAAATALAAAQMLWALAPAAIALLVMAGLRRPAPAYAAA
jgi:ABC-2 type transport system permease protein